MMRFLDIFLICILVTASWKTISGESPRKIGSLLLEKVISDMLIPELSGNWDSKLALGRRLLQENGADVKDISVKSLDQTGTKLEQGKEERSDIKQEENTENKTKQSQEVMKDGRHAVGQDRVDEQETSERIKDMLVHQQGNKQIEAKIEETVKPSQKQGDIKENGNLNKVKVDNLERESGNQAINNTGSALKSTQTKAEEAVTKGIQAQNEENTNAGVKEESLGAEKKEGTEAKPKGQVEEKSEEQSAGVVQDQEAHEKKETSVEEKEERKVTVQQREDQKIAKRDSGEKGDTADGGKIQQKSTAELETNLAGKKVVGDVKQKGGDIEEEKNMDQKLEIKSKNGTLGNKLEQRDNTEGDKVEQKTSETEGKETVSEGSGGKPVAGKPHNNVDADVKLSKEQEVKGKDNEAEKAKEKEKGSERGKGEMGEKKIDSSQRKEEASGKDKVEVELHAEDVKEDRPSDTVDLDVTSVGGTLSRQAKDPDDDEYGDIVQEFADLPFKFQGTAEKVAEHLAPDLLKLTDTSKNYFNMANQHIAESFSPLIGKDYAPFLASVISYALLFLPLVVVVILFEHIRALLSLQKILLFINIYLAAYFATLLLASFVIGSEPMAFFYKNSLSSYIYLQLLQALGYFVYLILQTFSIVTSCSSDTFSAKLTAVLQWVVAILVGLHYYMTIFQRAMATKAPRTSWKVYGIYSVSFFILCLFARIKRLKKQYVHAADGSTDKKN